MATLLLIIIYISFISLGLPDSLLGSAWPSIYKEIAVPVSYAGIVSMMIAGCTIISSFFSEKLIRKFGTGLITAVSVMLTAGALLGFSVSPGFVWFCLLAIPLGLGAGCVDSVLNNFVALHYKARHMSWLHCFWGIGATAGPIIMSYFLVRGNQWQSGYRTIGILQVCLVVILFLSLPLWRKVTTTQKAEEVLESKSPKYKELLGIPGAKPALLSFFCYCALESTTGLWGSSYLVLYKGIKAETAAGFISLFYLGITIGRFISGFVTMKFNNKSMIRIGESILLLGVLSLFLPLGNVTLEGGFLLIGLGCAPIFPCMLHETPNRFGKSLSQALMGIQMACAYVGSTFMPPLFGVIAEKITISLFPVFIFVMFIFMALASEVINRKNKTGIEAK